jgi:hypothetical protein
MPNTLSRFRGALLGLAAGDALGTTVEFLPRGSFGPLTDMTGGGHFGLRAGQWTDDTSMALCLARSLLDADGFDARDQMQRYLRWWKHGYLSSTGARPGRSLLVRRGGRAQLQVREARARRRGARSARLARPARRVRRARREALEGAGRANRRERERGALTRIGFARARRGTLPPRLASLSA